MRGGFPLSLRLIREIHHHLLAKGRGSDRQPGEFRTSQNWIGGSRPGNAAFVPPPPNALMESLGQLELFLHEDRPDLPALLKAALAHVQFETIHPFLDGNGRVGRLLITLLLCSEGALQEPILYLSLFFKTHRSEYYELLNRVRQHGDWESWVEFFLRGVKETAEQAASAARRILTLFNQTEQTLATVKAPANAHRILRQLQMNPLTSIAGMMKALDLTAPTVTKSLILMQEAGVIDEITGRQRGRLFVFRYLDILSEGTEPLKLDAR